MRYLFRALRGDENIEDGLTAKGCDNVSMTLETHVSRTQNNTPWISATCSLPVVYNNFSEGNNFSESSICIIDLDKVNCLPDCSMNRDDWTKRAADLGTTRQEFTFFQSVPKEAVEIFLTKDEFRSINDEFGENDIGLLSALDKSLVREMKNFVNDAKSQAGKFHRNLTVAQYQNISDKLLWCMQYGCCELWSKGYKAAAKKCYISCCKALNYMKETTRQCYPSLKNRKLIIPNVELDEKYVQMVNNITANPKNIANYEKTTFLLQAFAVRQDVNNLALVQNRHPGIIQYAMECMRATNAFENAKSLEGIPYVQTEVDNTELLKQMNSEIHHHENIFYDMPSKMLFTGDEELQSLVREIYGGSIVNGYWKTESNKVKEIMRAATVQEHEQRKVESI